MADAAEGPDAAGLSDTFGYIFVLGNTFFVLAVCWTQIFSNFLKFAFFLQNFAKNVRGARCGRSVGYIFSIGNFGGKNFFSNFLKSFSIFSVFSQKMSLFVPGGVQWWEGAYWGGMQGYMFSICCFWAHVKLIIFLDPSDASTSYPFMHEHLFECKCLYMTATAQLQGKVTSVSTVV